MGIYRQRIHRDPKLPLMAWAMHAWTLEEMATCGLEFVQCEYPGCYKAMIKPRGTTRCSKHSGAIKWVQAKLFAA